MSNQKYVIGADGGGTKTLGIIATLDGTELARRQVGPGNPNVAGVNAAARNLVDLVLGCCADVACEPTALDAVMLGLAGVGSKPIREQLADHLRQLFAERGYARINLGIDTDARIALEGAFGGAPGVIVIAGTGSIVLGKTGAGESLVVGGWGRAMGDEGSGFFLGTEALRRIVREIDGREDGASRLRAQVKERFGWESREDVIVAVYQQKFEIPSLAPIVLDSAAAGDEAAEEIVRRGADLLAEQVGVVVRQMPTADRVGVVFVGGLIGSPTVYARILAEHLQHRFARVDVRSPLFGPAEGAVLMALAMAGRR